MRPYMVVDALRPEEIVRIHSAAVSILSRTGFAVEHQVIREAYADYGARVNHHAQRVWFPEEVVDRFLEETEETKPLFDPGASAASTDAGAYECFRPLCSGASPSLSLRSDVAYDYYLEPGTNRVLPFTAETLAGYIKLAQMLDNGIIVRLDTVPVGEGRPTQPLEARIFAWKYGALDSGGIQMSELCPYLLEMYEIKADAVGRSLSEVFCGSVYIISPLRIPRDVGAAIAYFHKRGLRVRIGNMLSLGGAGPVTLAGSLALNLAERIAIGILERVLFGAKQWVLYGEIAPLDMTTLTLLSGRPEVLLVNLAVIQLARHYRVPAHPYGGYTDAKVPSAEAGMQKVLTALPCILAGGCNIDAGKLGGSLCSPIQMVLDSELISALKRVLRGFEVSDDSLAIDAIDQVGPGGTFLPTRHTARNMRAELWSPRVWSPEGYQAWVTEGTVLDSDRAFDVWQDLMARPDPEPMLDEGTERRLQAVVDRAARSL